MSKNEQRARLSYTMSYKGIVVGGMSQYHPEKMDIIVSMTLDHIEGESAEDTKKRLQSMKETEKVIVEGVGASVAQKVNEIKKRFQSNVDKLSKN